MSVRALKEFLIQREGSVLAAWRRHFKDDDGLGIDFDQFRDGLNNMFFKREDREIKNLWAGIDVHKHGQICLDDLDHQSETLWVTFSQFCGQRFESGQDMLSRVGDGSRATRPQFRSGLLLIGWQGEKEDVLFDSMDKTGSGYVTVEDLDWIQDVSKKHQCKVNAKALVLNNTDLRIKDKIARLNALRDFKEFLLKSHNNLFHAWRREFCLDDSMSLHRRELFKACHDMNWKGDTKALWRALDADNSGVAGLEELDLQIARDLAKYKAWADKKFGSSKALFQALGKGGAHKIPLDECVTVAMRRGFPGNRGAAQHFFVMLDLDKKRVFTEKEFLVLDTWKPAPWLRALPNPKAAEDFRALLIEMYGHPVRAWRSALDLDGSNHVSWREFEDGAKRLGFTGDIPGAWLVIDADSSGYVTLKELDPTAGDYCELMNFKAWAETEFGGVRSAFKVFGAVGSKGLTFLEFRSMCKNYGYLGHCQVVFNALDCDGNQNITLQEVGFLDELVPEDKSITGIDGRGLDGDDDHEDSLSGGVSVDNATKKRKAASIPEVAAVAAWYSLRRGARSPDSRSPSRNATFPFPNSSRMSKMTLNPSIGASVAWMKSAEQPKSSSNKWGNGSKRVYEISDGEPSAFAVRSQTHGLQLSQLLRTGPKFFSKLGGKRTNQSLNEAYWRGV